MNEKIQIGLFERLSLRHWYKYLLYVSGVLLVLAVALDLKIEQSKVLTFSLWTMGLSLFVWIFEDIFVILMTYYEEQHRTRYGSEEMTEEEQWIVIIREILHFIVFFVWIGQVRFAFF